MESPRVLLPAPSGTRPPARAGLETTSSVARTRREPTTPRASAPDQPADEDAEAERNAEEEPADDEHLPREHGWTKCPAPGSALAAQAHHRCRSRHRSTDRLRHGRSDLLGVDAEVEQDARGDA